MKYKKSNYRPYPGFYDLRIFTLNSREFAAAWRVQEFLYHAAKREDYYKSYEPMQWEGIKETAAELQMILLPKLKAGKELK